MGENTLPSVQDLVYDPFKGFLESSGKDFGLWVFFLLERIMLFPWHYFFFFLSDGRLCCFRCVSFKSSKGQLKQGEAFPFPTHTLHKIKPLLYKWCFTTKTLKDASRTHIGYFIFLLLCFSRVHDIWVF